MWQRISGLFRQKGLESSRYSLSFIVFLVLSAAIIAVNLRIREYEKPFRVIQDDVNQYYIYLPAAFVYQDPLFSFYDSPGYDRSRVYLARSPETGNRIPKMSMGMAIVYSPFFLAAHYGYVSWAAPETDFYGLPYRFALTAGSMIYFIIGLWLLRRILLRYFSDLVTAITIFVVGAGTNILWYVTHEPAMPHVFDFTLVLALTELTYRWVNKPGYLKAISIGIVLGLLILIRPNNIVFGVIVLLMPGDFRFTFRSRMRLFLTNYRQTMLIVAGVLLVWLPQLLFWKYAGGSWFYYSYGKEGFFFENPQVISSWFSWRKGWLLYTPLMALTLPGLYFLYKRKLGLFLPLLVILVLFTWINSSWWCWWFGGSFGNRSYIDAYGLFALAVAATVEAVLKSRKPLLRGVFLSVAGLLVMLNLFQHWQYRHGYLHYASMTREAYFRGFLKTRLTQEYADALVWPDHKAGMNGVYYPFWEISEGDKRAKRARINKNASQLIDVLKSKALSDTVLLNRIFTNGSYADVDSTRVLEEWAVKEYTRMLK